MTGLMERAKRLLGGGSSVAARVTGLDSAVAAGRGRLDGPELDHADTVVQRAGRRLQLSSDHTVVALGGATGSGKSSTFNALTGLDIAAVGVRRPTTSWATACVWGASGADSLLDWLEIPPRHRVSRDSTLDVRGDAQRDLQGLVLLDLPDHDSTEVSHHLEVERLVALADMLVWVLDPQKYADAAIHDRYLKPLASHRDVMLIVLNHIDEVPLARRDAMVADCRRLLDADGLHDVPLVVASAKDGTGMDELRDHIARRVRDKDSVNARLLADVLVAAEDLSQVSGPAPTAALDDRRSAELVDACVDAAGVPALVEAVEASVRHRTRRTTNWPLFSAFTRRRDPLAAATRGGGRVTALHRARIDTAVRETVDEVTADLSPRWTAAVRAASVDTLPELEDALDRAVAGVDLGADRPPAWSRLLQLLQVLAFTAALAGVGWLGYLAVVPMTGGDAPEPPQAAGMSLPVLLALGGLVAGIALTVLGALSAGLAARSAGRRARSRLEAAVREVVARLVIAPVEAELDSCRAARAGLDTALR
ncbi:GTPase [Nocardioides massiliensis]|uniref:GTP-binding protein EngB required for normal cell division n=1 Tax=Nocardioides massiliensis TaxID=1325935 RepID=A0ABT9NPF4_9ACTN|nr:GTPase [Nocardioides massiliensis]MDP9822311.1 GTP-binding protein EngB required for normal cell division [Nocardioides massiliensis]